MSQARTFIKGLLFPINSPRINLPLFLEYAFRHLNARVLLGNWRFLFTASNSQLPDYYFFCFVNCDK